MVALVANWVKQGVSGTPGTGTISFGSVPAGFIGFDQAFSTGNTVHYTIEDGDDREIGIGTLTTGSPWTMARTTVLETLDGGVYDNTSPTAISLTSAAVVGVAPVAYMPGTVVGRNESSDATYTTLTTVLTQDDTIPQNTEGTEIITCAYTPKYASSILDVKFRSDILLVSAGDWVQLALFRDSAADAIAVSAAFGSSSFFSNNDGLGIRTSAGSLSATTFKVRGSLGTTGNVYLNGTTTGRFFGGVSQFRLSVEEIRQ